MQILFKERAGCILVFKMIPYISLFQSKIHHLFSKTIHKLIAIIYKRLKKHSWHPGWDFCLNPQTKGRENACHSFRSSRGQIFTRMIPMIVSITGSSRKSLHLPYCGKGWAIMLREMHLAVSCITETRINNTHWFNSWIFPWNKGSTLQCPMLSSRTLLVRWKWLESGHCLVIVWSKSGQSLVKVCSSQKMTGIACPAGLWWTLTRQWLDFDQNLTEYFSFWQNNLALGSLDGLHWTLKQASQTTCMQTSPNKERFWHILAN